MRRFGLSFLAAIFVLTTAHAATAAKAKGGGKRVKGEKVAPLASSKAISDFKGEFKWGMAPSGVLEKLNAKIEAGYKERIEAARSDPAKSDQIRREIKNDKDRVAKSQVKFDGAKGAWDVSIIDAEFLRNNGESMLIYKEPKSTRYFFFSGDALYKMFVAFDKDVVAGKSFEDFGKIMQTSYGKAQPVYRDMAMPGGGKQKVLDSYLWRSTEGDGLRLVDRSKFYDVYCLVIYDNAVEQRQNDARRNLEASQPKGSFVDGIITDKPNERDENDNVVDRITGKDVLKPGDKRGGGQNIKVPSPTGEMKGEEK
jgi:hypothetical protein